MNETPTSAPDPRISARRLRWVLLGVFFVLFVVLFICFRIYVERRLEATLEAIRAKGDPTTPRELDKLRVAPSPGAENAASIYSDAYSRFQLNDDEIRNPFLPVFGSGFPLLFPDEPLTDEVVGAGANFLERQAEALTRLDRADGVPHYFVPTRFSSDGLLETWFLSESIEIAQLRMLQSMIAAERGEAERAVLSARGVLRLQERLATEHPILITYLVRLAIQSMAADTVERMANRTALSDAQLADLIAMLNSAYDPRAMRQAMIAERTNIITYWRLRLDPASYGSRIMFRGGRLGRTQLRGYNAIGLGTMDRQLSLDYMAEYLGAAGLPLHERHEAARKIDAENYTSGIRAFYSELCEIVLPALNRAFQLETQAVAKLRVAIAGLATERCRLAQGKLPDSLDELVPRFLVAVPEDPFTGKPLTYRKRVKGFVVYSLGEGGTDDGGVAAPPGSDPGASGSDIPFRMFR